MSTRSKNFGPGRCVHCLNEVEERNSDHVFPESWYPDSTPTDLEKWQIPSCIPCNRAYGKIEQDFLIKVGLCLDPHDVASASLVQKALRSLKPALARNPRDAEHRNRKREKILSEARTGENIPDHGIYPELNDRWKDVPGERTAILIPVDSFKRMTEKIVRGIFYIEDSKFIEPPYKVNFFALADADAQPIERELDKFGKTYSREPGIAVRRAVVAEDGMSSVFAITFWRQFKTYAVVSQG
jgi:hypothetical protein